MPAENSLTARYFDDVYRANEDPWQFTTSPYEKAKYEATLAALPRDRYDTAFEIGCSIGVLSALLAPRCGQLLAVDASELPLQQARERLKSFPQATVRRMQLPDEFPDQSFALILLSEVGYYFNRADLAVVRARLIDHLQPGGHLVLVHWTPAVHDYPLTGDAVHDFFLEEARPDRPLRHLNGGRADTYRLDVFEKTA